jgi:rubrerythrin
MKFGDYVIKSIGSTAVKTSCKDAKLIRLAMQEELQAVSDYTMRAKMAENEATKKLFLDIAKEERVHFEEFEELLEVIDAEYEESEEEAEIESEDMFGEEEDEFEDE